LALSLTVQPLNQARAPGYALIHHSTIDGRPAPLSMREIVIDA
jgi:hypothetical protein